MTSTPPPKKWEYEPPGGRRHRRRRLILTGGALAAAVIGLVVLLTVWTSDQSGTDTADTPAAPPAAATTMGQPISDGNIQFLVRSVEPVEVPPGEPAEQFQVVTLELTNTGPSTQSVSIGDQILIDDHGHQYHRDPLIASELNNAQGAIELQSHDTATVRLPFDVPTGATPTTVVLHAGPLTPGVAVNLH